MGRERTRAWKYIHFCIASLIFLLLFSCVTLEDVRQEREARKYLLRGHELFAQKNYEDALKEYRRVLRLSAQKREGAEALFHTGLIYAHFGYSKRNYEASLNSFVRLLNDYPESPLVDQARIWVGVLQENKRISQMVERSRQPARISEKPGRAETKAEESGAAREYLLRGQRLLARGDYEGSINENQKVLSMAAHRPPGDEALFNLGLIYAHSGNPNKDFEKSLKFFRKLIKDHPGSPLVEQAKIWVELLMENEELSGVIQKLKQVDIEVEQKKRETTK